MLRQIQVIYFNREEKPTNKVGKMDAVGNNNIKIANKVIHICIHSITF